MHKVEDFLHYSTNVYYSNIPPRPIYLQELKKWGYISEYKLLKRAWSLLEYLTLTDNHFYQQSNRLNLDLCRYQGSKVLIAIYTQGSGHKCHYPPVKAWAQR